MNSKFTKIIEFINHQLNINIESISSVSNKPRTYINVELNKLETREKRLIESLAFSSKKFKLKPNGGYGFALSVN